MQKLYEHGFSIGRLTEEFDVLRKQGISRQECLYYLCQLSDVDAKLDGWYQAVLEKSPRPLYWINISDSGHTSLDMSSPTSRTPFTFKSLRAAIACIKYWALKIVVSVVIATICETHNACDNLAAEDFIQHSGSNLDTFINRYSQSQRFDLAINVVRAMPYFLDNGVGLFGAQRSLFSIRVALYILYQHPGEDLRRCHTLYQQLTSSKGLGYAREIAKREGGYSRSRDKSPSPSPEITAKDLPYRVQPIGQPSDSSSGSSRS